ncbi:50S ribosomal protein L7ae [Clostridium vincentii]|uniref:Putative ribosomal protein L7Ae-like protein n=1 Tax=Clostridium vincentii TaxID=52704 RepID=A0A2T0B7M8_9CLOT|nr:50S ribosomal protein L7ae [Clostridium vincentii]PRR79807.1 putative ribosomal protein L7Ae-like protein [Clostridium vincentii]
MYVAKDVDKKSIVSLIDLANNCRIKIEAVDTMTELGMICEMEVKALVTLIL